MFRKILVAVDRSEINEQVLTEAIDLAKTNDGNLMLLHVLSLDDDVMLAEHPSLSFTPDALAPVMESFQERWKTREEIGLTLLRSLAETAKEAGLEAEFSQNPGSPGATICALARTWEADLIVMGRRGLSGFSEFLMGSVSNYVLHHAPCSVLTVQHGTGKGT